ncbi:ABC transporter permease [Ornithinibacillus sp. L9]|uniref:ABC transporter permease n=1 Tax=Ornithinibacillus caprae TaxID=2678566 RepID=A0A6N8FM63_9BACI|nr:ABC transporter permease [Ornithinibacillus caprae]MUK88408.1 ABC transporter permease [Ornithinibacillus caprae]
MGSFFKKDLLVFWRDRKEILLSLLLPIVIIFVLNIAFTGVFESESESVTIDLAIVQEDDEALGFEQFEETLSDMDFSVEEREQVLEQAGEVTPIQLIHELFNDPELKEWINIQELTEAEASESVEAGTLDAIIKLPEGFTYGVLSQVMLGEQSEIPLTIQAEEQSNEVSVLQEIVYNFINTINLQFAIGATTGSDITEAKLPQGGTEIVEGVETYTITQYFTIAMTTLFALFISQTIALKTVTEKRERVFNRILLTNSNPLNYLMGKMLATFCITWLQMMITITVSQLILDVFPERNFDFWIGLIMVITVFALTVAGLSAIFTTITLNMHDSNAVSGLTTLIIMTLGVLGGGFFPIQGLPVFMQKIGEWTPNGLTQVTLIEWIQYTEMKGLVMPIIILIVFFIVCIIIGMAIFPRRGRV